MFDARPARQFLRAGEIVKRPRDDSVERQLVERLRDLQVESRREVRVVERVAQKDVETLSREAPAARRLRKSHCKIFRRGIQRAAKRSFCAAGERPQRNRTEEILRGRDDPGRALPAHRRRPDREHRHVALDGADQWERDLLLTTSGSPSFQFHHFSFSGSGWRVLA